MVSIALRLRKLPLAPVLWNWKRHILELALYVGAYLVYLLTRGLVFGDAGTALGNAGRVIDLEQSLGFFWEPGWQAWTVDSAQFLLVLFNWVYIITYWPVILAMSLLLYLFNRRLYYYYRTVILINLAFALTVFLLFPLAPPFKTVHLLDAIQTFGPTFYGSPEMAGYYNTNAAMPSLHFSWTLVLGALFIRHLRGWAKILGLLYPLLTFFAITITGNHYILDAIGGAVLVLAAFAVMELVMRRHRYLPWLRTGKGKREEA